MKFATSSAAFTLGFAALLMFSATGCGEKEGGKKGGDKVVKKDPHKDHKHGKDDSDAWWCAEHGVPEDLCSLCMSDDDAKKKFKDSGDWCKLHDRAQSQCFKCEPNLYAKYEAMYEAKYGKKPSRPPEEEFKK